MRRHTTSKSRRQNPPLSETQWRTLKDVEREAKKAGSHISVVYPVKVKKLIEAWDVAEREERDTGVEWSPVEYQGKYAVVPDQWLVLVRALNREGITMAEAMRIQPQRGEGEVKGGQGIKGAMKAFWREASKMENPDYKPAKQAMIRQHESFVGKWTSDRAQKGPGTVVKVGKVEGGRVRVEVDDMTALVRPSDLVPVGAKSGDVTRGTIQGGKLVFRVENPFLEGVVTSVIGSAIAFAGLRKYEMEEHRGEPLSHEEIEEMANPHHNPGMDRKTKSVITKRLKDIGVYKPYISVEGDKISIESYPLEAVIKPRQDSNLGPVHDYKIVDVHTYQVLASGVLTMGQDMASRVGALLKELHAPAYQQAKLREAEAMKRSTQNPGGRPHTHFKGLVKTFESRGDVDDPKALAAWIEKGKHGSKWPNPMGDITPGSAFHSVVGKAKLRESVKLSPEDARFMVGYRDRLLPSPGHFRVYQIHPQSNSVIYLINRGGDYYLEDYRDVTSNPGPGSGSHSPAASAGIHAGTHYGLAVLSKGLSAPTYGTIQSAWYEFSGTHSAQGPQFEEFRRGYAEGYLAAVGGRRSNPQGWDEIDMRREGYKEGQRLVSATGIPTQGLKRLSTSEVSKAFNIWKQYDGAHYFSSGVSPEELKSARAAWIQGYKGNYGARNPESSAASMYETFHGRPSTEVLEVEESVHYHENLAALGELVELKVATPTRKDVTINFDSGTQLASNEDGTQLYIIGGDQSLDLGEMGFKGPAADKECVDLGILYELTYHTQKSFHKFKPTDYYHALGEETGDQPRLLYDRVNCLLSVAGGSYEIKDVGITN